MLGHKSRRLPPDARCYLPTGPGEGTDLRTTLRRLGPFIRHSWVVGEWHAATARGNAQGKGGGPEGLGTGRFAEPGSCCPGLCPTPHDWNLAAAQKEIQRAIELNPNDSNAHHWYSHYLTAAARNQESLAESKRAQHLDPLDPIISIHLEEKRPCRQFGCQEPPGRHRSRPAAAGLSPRRSRLIPLGCQNHILTRPISSSQNPQGSPGC